MKIQRDDVTLELVRGSIAAQEGFDAVVNAANARLEPGGGVAGAIHRGAGPGLARECRPLGPIEPGEAVLTGGHRLPNPYVIHCLGPVWGRDEPADELLRRCYRRALELAEEHGLSSIAFPALSTGAFGYPLPQAARASIDEIVSALPRLRSVRRIRFTLFGDEALEAYRKALRDRTGQEEGD